MRLKGFILDLDGTVYLGDRLIAGAAEAIVWMRSMGHVVFLTNKPIDSPASYADKLTRLGVATATEDVITSVAATIAYLGRVWPAAKFHLIGEPYLERELTDAGLTLSSSPSETDVVIVSLDRDLNYAKLHHAYEAARSGAKVYATNPDLVCPTGQGDIIDAGATIAAIEALMGRRIDGVFGKPSLGMAETARLRTRSLPRETLVVGDRIETDIAMGIQAGMRTALVLSGATDRQRAIDSDQQPDFTVSSLSELPRVLGA